MARTRTCSRAAPAPACGACANACTGCTAMPRGSTSRAPRKPVSARRCTFRSLCAAMTERTRVSVLVVDDEPVARAGLRQLLAEIDWLECIGEADNGEAAVQAIDALRPELVLLDIQMPGMSGLDVLRTITHQPLIVFTTAYAQHAVTAFELGALDYLLKPFGEERLRAALERVRALLGEPRPSAF